MLINISEQNTIKYKLINTLQSAVSSVDYISSLFLKTVCLALNFFHTLYCSYSLPSLFFSFYRWTYKLDPCFKAEHKGLGGGRGLASKKPLPPHASCLFHSLHVIFHNVLFEKILSLWTVCFDCRISSYTNYTQKSILQFKMSFCFF